MPPSFEGEYGSKNLMRAAGSAAGFRLDDGHAMEALRDWNATCVGPWSDDELLRAIGRARKGRKNFFDELPPRNVSTSTGTSTGTKGKAAGPHYTAVVVCLADVRPRNVTWLWPGRIPFGKLTIIDGDPGLGKSTLSLEIAARLTTGRAMPDGIALEPANVIMMTTEDDLDDTVRPRLDAAGADVNRFFSITGALSE